MLLSARSPLGLRGPLLTLPYTALCRRLSAVPLKKTPLYDLHKELKGQMVPYAGWSLPVKYGDQSIVDSHLHTRSSASIFDVSHMLQLRITGKDRVAFMETMVGGDLQALGTTGKGALNLLTTEQGTILDDTIITAHPDHLYMVSNAACAQQDLRHLQTHLSQAKESSPGMDVSIQTIDDHALVALQGPKAAEALKGILSDKSINLDTLYFMNSIPNLPLLDLEGHQVPCHVARSGYTGEDGFELSIPSDQASSITRNLLRQPGVLPAGLGARDTLRLEAGMCLYGNDIDQTTSPVEAALLWTVGKRRRTDGGFLGANRIQDDIALGVTRKRVGIRMDGDRVPAARGGSQVFLGPEEGQDTTESGKVIGQVTSGGPSPCLQKNIAMAYVSKEVSKIGRKVQLKVHGKLFPGTIVRMPFVPSHYHTPPSRTS